jgi:hypothetical protein
MTRIILEIDGKQVAWVLDTEDPGWDCFIDGEEQIDLGALTHNGVFTRLSHFLTNPEEMIIERRSTNDGINPRLPAR